jgi:serine/threonine-protein kinase
MLAIGGVVAWAIVQSLPKTPSMATIPTVKGQASDAAQAALRKAGFDPVVVNQNNPTVADGLVIDTDPPGGQRARRGSDVKVFVSTGPGIAVVPDLKGKTQEEATQALTAAGLQLGNVSRAASSAADKDKVISQNPTANRRVDRTEKVDIVLGSGPEMAPVPTVVGQREADASAALQAAGFRVAVMRRSVGAGCFVAPGRVCDQDPDGGQVREKGSTVTIFVAEGGGGDPSPTPTATDTGG